MGLLLTAPGVPMIFMGQEFLEDKLWSDNPNRSDVFLWWDGQQGADPNMVNFHGFTRDLAWLRRRHPALRGEGANVFHIDEYNRILAFQRWLPGEGRDVVVVMSLREETFYDHGYSIGFPQPGHWHEVFNSDAYDGTQGWIPGNPGGITAEGPPRDGMPWSAGITIPANSLLVFARDRGD
jgi:1,4-alpha-glucan branching enzyme